MKNIVSEKSKIRYLNLFVYLLLFYLIPSKGMKSNVFKIENVNKNLLLYPLFFSLKEKASRVINNIIKKEEEKKIKEIKEYKKRAVEVLSCFLEDALDYEENESSFAKIEEIKNFNINYLLIDKEKIEKNIYLSRISYQKPIIKIIIGSIKGPGEEINNLSMEDLLRIIGYSQETIKNQQFLFSKEVNSFNIFYKPLFYFIKKIGEQELKNSLKQQDLMIKKKIISNLEGIEKEISIVIKSFGRVYPTEIDEINLFKVQRVPFQNSLYKEGDVLVIFPIEDNRSIEIIFSYLVNYGIEKIYVLEENNSSLSSGRHKIYNFREGDIKENVLKCIRDNLYFAFSKKTSFEDILNLLKKSKHILHQLGFSKFSSRGKSSKSGIVIQKNKKDKELIRLLLLNGLDQKILNEK